MVQDVSEKSCATVWVWCMRTTDQVGIKKGSQLFNLRGMVSLRRDVPNGYRGRTPRGTGAIPTLKGPFHEPLPPIILKTFVKENNCKRSVFRNCMADKITRLQPTKLIILE